MTPPTTPPAIAPVDEVCLDEGLAEALGLEEGDGDCVELDVVETKDADGAADSGASAIKLCLYEF